MSTIAARESILQLAIYSRLAVLILSFVSNAIIPDHNATDVFIYKSDDKLEDKGSIDRIVYLLFGGLIRWDANYFLHISHYGYTKENVLAFFPLFPFIVRTLASFLWLFVDGFLSYSGALLITSVFVNFILFIKCSLLLYDLSVKILKCNTTAYYAALVFCVNPASIFFTAPYSETLFSYLTFSTMIHSFNNNFIVSSMIAGLSCSTRSNGILNVGFILFNVLIFFIRNFTLSFHYLFSAITLFVVCVVISLAPFCLFQLYAYIKFCLNNTDYASSIAIDDPLLKSRWCDDRLPLAYSYVQNHYWNVGFLSYYQLKQIPNFLLALPILYIILFNSFKKLKDNKDFFYSIFNILYITSEIKNKNQSIINKLMYIVFIAHASALAIFCLLFVHVQVSTRMLCSSSPVFYWFIADNFMKNYNKICSDGFNERLSKSLANVRNKKPSANLKSDKNQNMANFKSVKNCQKMFFCDINNCSVLQFYIRLYIVLYFAAGTALFSNFYPWT